VKLIVSQLVKKFPRLYWNTKPHSRVHKSPSLVNTSILRQINPVPPPHYVSLRSISATYQSTLSCFKWAQASSFPIKILYEFISHTHSSNAVIEWLTILLRIRGVLGSNLGTCDRKAWLMFFVVLFSPFRRIPGYSTLKLGHDRFQPIPFQFIIVCCIV
jgi:hypothetical protein